MEGAKAMPTTSGPFRSARKHVSGFQVSSQCNEQTDDGDPACTFKTFLNVWVWCC